MQTYKILRNTENVHYRKFFIGADTVQLRGHNCFFSQRVVKCWNLLPLEVVDAPALEVIKNRLDKFMDSNELGNKS